MGKIICRVRIVVPVFKKPPIGMAEKWLTHCVEAVSKIKRGIKRAFPNRGVWLKKVVRPLRNAYAQMVQSMSRNYRTKHGLTREDIIRKQKSGKFQAAERYFTKLNKIYKTVNGVKGKDFLRRLEAVAERYAREITKSLLPFSGHKDLGIGVASIATCWLSGDAKIIPLLRKTDKILEGGPILITQPERAGMFRRKLRGRLIQQGRFIILLHYKPNVIEQANQEINKLVNEYRCPEIAPFNPDGASHIDFVMDETSEGKELILDIQVSSS